MKKNSNHWRPTEILIFAGVTALGVACAESTAIDIGQVPAVGDGGPAGVFIGADAGNADAEPAVSAPVTMCPVTACSYPSATCPSSKSPCDVDLLRDDENCGACGVRCYDEYDRDFPNWTCVAGRCTFGCQQSTANCDGDPSNGCEVLLEYDSNNCGDCGIKCPEGYGCSGGACVNGCSLRKPDSCDGTCTNMALDDKNCGSCGHICDPAEPGLPPLPADMYYGCDLAFCAKKKCRNANTADCNDDRGDGCETPIHDNENCAGCGDKCRPGKECTRIGGTFACLCDDDNEALCGGECRRLDDDPLNCGGCDRICPGAYLPHFSATCSRGVCGGRCGVGYADCDRLTDSGCEVDIRVDNRHCGACANACLPGQVCSGGKCLVAPCDAGAAEGTTN